MEVGERIEHRMRALGLNQVTLAQRSGLTQQVISQYVRKRSKPGYDALIALAKGLDVPPGWFFEKNALDNN